MDNMNTCAQIAYHNNSLLSILNQREKQKDIFGIDVDELLTEMKFKVLFSTNQVRQNLKDYILKIYRSIIDENNIKIKLIFAVAIGNKNTILRVTIAHWFHFHIPSFGPGFKSNLHNQCFLVY